MVGNGICAVKLGEVVVMFETFRNTLRTTLSYLDFMLNMVLASKKSKFGVVMNEGRRTGK